MILGKRGESHFLKYAMMYGKRSMTEIAESLSKKDFFKAKYLHSMKKQFERPF